MNVIDNKTLKKEHYQLTSVKCVTMADDWEFIEMTLSKLLKEDKIIKIGTYKNAMYYRK